MIILLIHDITWKFNREAEIMRYKKGEREKTIPRKINFKYRAC
jgi:hypothetical protein